MTQAVVVGVDGSESAFAAAERALRVATALGAELHVVCAYAVGHYDVEAGDDGVEKLVVADEIAALATATRVRDRLLGAAPRVAIVPAAHGGKPAAALVRSAEETGAELIVVGNKRVQGFSRVLGSIATEVLRKAPCDVYIAYTHDRR
jgi:nucleotide-binding universal stress UspA family protein